METSNPIIKAKIMIYDTKAAIIHCPKCETVYQPTISSTVSVYKSEYKKDEDSNVFAIHGPPGTKPRINSNTNKSENPFTLTKDVSMRKTTELERNLALIIAPHNFTIDILENQFLPKIVGDSNAMIPSVAHR